MYSRSSRKFDWNPNESIRYPNIGPGIYYVNGTEEKKGKGFAPFDSLTKKVSIFDELAIPGPPPGKYDLEMSFMTAVKKEPPTTVFGRSKVSRFDKSETISPGPAAYKTPADANANMTKKLKHPSITPSALEPQLASEETAAENNRIKWVRKFIPPSIPYGKFQEGYDLTQEGELAIRKPKKKQSARKMNLKGFVEENKLLGKGTQFSKSKSTKCKLFSIKEGPGVGAYNLLPLEPQKLDAIKDTTKEIKDLRFTDQIVAKAKKFAFPGPTSYNLQKDTTNVSRKGPKYVRAGKGHDDSFLGHRDKYVTPGPSQYLTQEPGKNKAANTIVPFNSTESRFRHDSVNPEMGPGVYEVENMTNFKVQVHRKQQAMILKPFNTTVKRGSKLFLMESTPAPTDYQPPLQQEQTNEHEQRTTFVFQSGQERFKTLVESSPAPGSYEVSLSHKLVTEKGLWWLKHGILSSGSNREPFKVTAPNTPGPNMYEPKLLGKKHPNVDIYKHSVIDVRFRAKISNTPGPGYYGPEETKSRNLNKKTFNVTLDSFKEINLSC